MSETLMRRPPGGDSGTDLRQAGGVRTRRVAGALATGGAVVMAGSAALMYSTGADMFTAVDEREMGRFLTEASAHTTTLYAHLDLWVLGAVSMALAVAMFAATSAQTASALAARFLAAAAGGAVIVFFPMMAGIVFGLEGRPELAPVGEALAYGAIAADDIATVCIVGLAPFLAVRSGRGDWAPEWLVRLAWAPLLAATLGLLPLGSAEPAMGLLIVPVGLATMIALGVVGLRGSRRAPEKV